MKFTNNKQEVEVEILILDVDGVLTDGSIILGNQGQEFKIFNSQDGLGIKRAQAHNIMVAIITGRESKIVENRAQELEITEVYQDIKEKGKKFDQLLYSLDISPDKAVYIGDDLNDIPALKKAGLACTVASGVEEVKREADYIAEKNGGAGAVREIIDKLLSGELTLKND